MRTARVWLAMLAACASGPIRPTCDDAMDRFYLVGCRYQPTEPEGVAYCERAVALTDQHANGNCDAELDAWIECLHTVPAGSTGPACCNHSYTELVNCLGPAWSRSRRSVLQ